MYSIFFDLETTDKEPIGQIINYCFITVDENWEQVSSLVGDIKISRLQLPQAGAILANRTNVLKHQASNPPSEYEAMIKICEYINSVIINSKEKKVYLIGYNSNRFDVPYLRTTLIRNGLNPYFGGNLIYKDLLHLVRKLACFCDEFPRTCAENGDPKILSLTLETNSKNLGLLDGVQKHHSFADVELTISLAKFLAEKFKADVRTEETYLAKDWNVGDVGLGVSPNYNLDESNRVETYPVMLFDNDYRYALWVNLDKFKGNPDKSSLIWVNKSQSPFFVIESEKALKGIKKLKEDISKKLEGINLNNFFEKSTCDIEQDIYRIDMRDIDLLHKVISPSSDISVTEFEKNKQDLRNCNTTDPSSVYARFKLANFKGEIRENKKGWELFKKYVQYRYNGKLQLRKSIVDEKALGNYAPKYEDLYAEIENGLAKEDISSEDKELLNALKKFYLDSEIYQALNEK